MLQLSAYVQFLPHLTCNYGQISFLERHTSVTLFGPTTFQKNDDIKVIKLKRIGYFSWHPPTLLRLWQSTMDTVTYATFVLNKVLIKPFIIFIRGEDNNSVTLKINGVFTQPDIKSRLFAFNIDKSGRRSGLFSCRHEEHSRYNSIRKTVIDLGQKC